MTLLVILNELSQPPDHTPRHEATIRVEKLWQLAFALARRRRDMQLISEAPLLKLPVGREYSVAQWIHDGDRREEKRFLLSLDQRSPFSSLRDLLPKGTPSEWDAFLLGERCQGLGLAHLAQGLAISWIGDDRWNSAKITVDLQLLAEADSGDLVFREEVASVPHASSVGHLESHETLLLTAGIDIPTSGFELWSRRLSLFPRLRFLPRVQSQLECLDPGTPHFSAVRKCLQELNREVGQWNPDEAAQPTWESKTTPESEPRRRRGLCDFTDEDGIKHSFSWHKRFTPGPGRIHFRLDGSAHLAIVAHIGRKLD